MRETKSCSGPKNIAGYFRCNVACHRGMHPMNGAFNKWDEEWCHRRQSFFQSRRSKCISNTCRPTESANLIWVSSVQSYGVDARDMLSWLQYTSENPGRTFSFRPRHIPTPLRRVVAYNISNVDFFANILCYTKEENIEFEPPIQMVPWIFTCWDWYHNDTFTLFVHKSQSAPYCFSFSCFTPTWYLRWSNWPHHGWRIARPHNGRK